MKTLNFPETNLLLQQGVVAFDASFVLSKYCYGNLTPLLLDLRVNFVAISKKNTDCNLIHNITQSDDNAGQMRHSFLSECVCFVFVIPCQIKSFFLSSFNVPCEPVTSD